MGRFIEGDDRGQMTLLPEALDDYVAQDNPVRVVDAFVDALDLASLGFDVVPEATGRPGYHPATLLKIYVYGYLNQVQSSRRLERESGRNLELMWLTGRLAPDFKTIADFRRDNGPAIQQACTRFVALCRDIHLLDGGVVAIDGSKFKAVNAKSRNFNREKIRRQLKELEEGIAGYMAELDRMDQVVTATGAPIPDARISYVMKRLAALKRDVAFREAMGEEIERRDDSQVSLTDPDARSMASTSRHPRTIGYNVQSAVDTKHHLIVAHEVTMAGSDRGQLARMARQARDAMAGDRLSVLADKGYYNGEEIVACEEEGISVAVPKPRTSNAKAGGRFDRAEFIYDPEADHYVCPAGQHLTYRYTNVEAGRTLHTYWTRKCDTCPIKAHCTPGPERRVRRWEHEAVLERVQARVEQDPQNMRQRRETVEHPFGTLKSWMGSTHFQMKRLPNVRTEMALHVLAYNIKRVMKIIGIPALLQAIAILLTQLSALLALITALSDLGRPQSAIPAPNGSIPAYTRPMAA